MDSDDAKNGIATYFYAYNSTFNYSQLVSIKDPRGYFRINNVQYDACGRVSQLTQQTGASGTTVTHRLALRVFR